LGEKHGDLGLQLIGPDLTDHCYRLPLIWKPSKSANVPAAEVTAPVGLIDLAPTFCKIAGGEVPEWMEGQRRPASDQEAQTQGRETVYTQYASHTPDASIIMNAVYADGYRCIVYERSMTYEGTEGELYKCGGGSPVPGQPVGRPCPPGDQEGPD
jgi:arylsulfatase A-like enzyme